MWIEVVTTAHEVRAASSSTMMYCHVDNRIIGSGISTCCAGIQDSDRWVTESLPLPSCPEQPA